MLCLCSIIVCVLRADTVTDVYSSLFCEGSGDHRDLHVLSPSFPARRSSDLPVRGMSQGLVFCGAASAGRAAAGSVRAAPGCVPAWQGSRCRHRSEEHTSELQSLMRISYAVFCLKKKTVMEQIDYMKNNIKDIPPISHIYSHITNHNIL